MITIEKVTIGDGKGGDMKDKMKFVHFRDYHTTTVCGHKHVHTTKKEFQVTCQCCKKLIAKRKIGP